MLEFKRKWKGFWQLANPKIWVASAVPMLVAGAISYKVYHYINIYWFIISLMGIFAIETGKHGINEWIDYITGVDSFVAVDKQTPFSGGRKTITEGILSVTEVVTISFISLVVAAIIGLYIVFFREGTIIWIGLAGFLIAIFYTLPPIKFIYNGLGELAVGVTYGPLMVMGTYLVQTQRMDILPLLISIPLGFLITNILWINQYPDYEADLKGNKRNWVVRMGKKKSLYVYVAIYLMAYISIIFASLIENQHIWLISLISIPLAIQSVRIAFKYYNDIPRLIKSNIRTIQVYQLTGLLLIISILAA